MNAPRICGHFGRSSVSSPNPARFECLESRRLLSAVQLTDTLAGDLDIGGVVNALDFNALASNFGVSSAPASRSLTTLSVKLPAMKGNFTGSYTGSNGKYAMSLTVLAHTHTGHFSGNAFFAGKGGTAEASFNGKVISTLHVHIDFAGKGFSGTLTGTTTRTGGQISGSYSVSGSVSGTGKFKVIKP